MKKLLLSVLLACTLLFFGCVPYKSDYRAVKMLTSGNDTERSLSFERLDGSYVFKLKAEQDGLLFYTAALESGEINVYYDNTGTKLFLCNLKSGETINDKGGYVDGGKITYVILETISPAKGSLTFSL